MNRAIEQALRADSPVSDSYSKVRGRAAQAQAFGAYFSSDETCVYSKEKSIALTRMLAINGSNLCRRAA